MYRKVASILALGTVFWLTPVSAQRANYPPQAEIPSSRLVPYVGSGFEIRFPDNWVVNKTGTAVTLAPQDGNIEGTLAYGMLADIFEPRNRSTGGPQAKELRGQVLVEVTDQLTEELRRTNPNLRVLRSVMQEVGGQPALELEVSNSSPVGGLESNRLITVLRPNGNLLYFLAVSPQAESNRYSSIFNRMFASIRFYN